MEDYLEVLNSLPLADVCLQVGESCLVFIIVWWLPKWVTSYCQSTCSFSFYCCTIVICAFPQGNGFLKMVQSDPLVDEIYVVVLKFSLRSLLFVFVECLIFLSHAADLKIVYFALK